MGTSNGYLRFTVRSSGSTALGYASPPAGLVSSGLAFPYLFSGSSALAMVGFDEISKVNQSFSYFLRTHCIH